MINSTNFWLFKNSKNSKKVLRLTVIKQETCRLLSYYNTDVELIRVAVTEGKPNLYATSIESHRHRRNFICKSLFKGEVTAFR